MITSPKLTVFLVVDDDVEAQEVQRSLHKVRMDVHFIRAKDGVEALEMLRGENGHTKLEGPILTLLDLKMPRMNGAEFLDELRADDDLKSLVVFMLTTSESDEDIARAYEQNIAGHIVKSASIDEYSLQLQTVVGSFRRSVIFPAA